MPVPSDKGNKEMKEEKEPFVTRKLGVFYRLVLVKALNHPAPLFAITALFLVLAAVVLPNLGRSFLPSFNEGSFTVNVSALPEFLSELSDSIGRPRGKTYFRSA